MTDTSFMSTAATFLPQALTMIALYLPFAIASLSN